MNINFETIFNEDIIVSTFYCNKKWKIDEELFIYIKSFLNKKKINFGKNQDENNN